MESILVVTTGGTIDKVYFDAKSDFQVGQSVVGELLRAGELCEDSDPEQAVTLLEAAAARDAAHLEVQATLARVRLATGAFEEAELAAGRALDLAATAGIDDVDLSVRQNIRQRHR